MSVSVSSFGSQRVYVGGEVIKPGPVQLQGQASLTQILGEAGWLTPLASNQEIVILRHGKNNKESVYHINSGKIISGEDTGQDVAVLAGDVILVPPSGVVDFDRWMDQNVRLAMPFNMNAGYIYSNTSNAELFR
jgi:polysaccharide export outer membrane protein